MNNLPPTRIGQILYYEDEVTRAHRRLLLTNDPEKKARIIWELAYVALPPIEDLRPAGGFGSGSPVPAPKPGLSFKVLFLATFLLLLLFLPVLFLFIRYKITHP